MKSERTKDMKRMCMIIMAAALIALPAMAQEWQSTSTMQGSGSAYSSQVTTVGAGNVNNMATTTYSPSNASSRPRRSANDPFAPNQDGGETGDTNAPIGDAMLPLMLMAAGFGLYTALRRRKKTA